MHTTSVGIFGASGFAGIEATRLIAGHGRLELKFLTSDRWVGETPAKRIGAAGPTSRLTYLSHQDGVAAARGCEAVLLATPAETSLELAPRLIRAGVRVIDLSGAFRLTDPSLYPAFYGFEHVEAEWLRRAVYGLPELNREQVRGASLIANPGCYATAATLAVFPLVRAGLLEPDLIVDAASGVTGAGRKASEEFSFTEIDGDFRAYKVLKHQHTPEIAQTLSAVAGTKLALTFTPHLLPVKRGILATVYGRLERRADPASLISALGDAYTQEPFVQVVRTPDEVNLKAVVGTNRCQIGVACDPDSRRVVITSAIDNLLKGAAGQAVQNLNLMIGLDETQGLLGLGTLHS